MDQLYHYDVNGNKVTREMRLRMRVVEIQAEIDKLHGDRDGQKQSGAGNKASSSRWTLEYVDIPDVPARDEGRRGLVSHPGIHGYEAREEKKKGKGKGKEGGVVVFLVHNPEISSSRNCAQSQVIIRPTRNLELCTKGLCTQFHDCERSSPGHAPSTLLEDLLASHQDQCLYL
jgi:hypothetical protein